MLFRFEYLNKMINVQPFMTSRLCIADASMCVCVIYVIKKKGKKTSAYALKWGKNYVWKKKGHYPCLEQVSTSSQGCEISSFQLISFFFFFFLTKFTSFLFFSAHIWPFYSNFTLFSSFFSAFPPFVVCGLSHHNRCKEMFWITEIQT